MAPMATTTSQHCHKQPSKQTNTQAPYGNVESKVMALITGYFAVESVYQFLVALKTLWTIPEESSFEESPAKRS